MIRHVVMWKLIAEDTEGQKAAVEAMATALEPLAGHIEGLESLIVRSDAGNVENNWDVVLISEHTSPEALVAYGTHPLHDGPAAIVGAHTRDRVCVDFEF